MNIKNVTFLLVLVCMVFSITVFAQRSTRVLVCNEKDSVTDSFNFPRNATIVKTVNGTLSYVEWDAMIGNDKGNYKLRISSYSDFSSQVWQKSKSPNSKWQKVGGGNNAFSAESGGNRYFQYEKVFYSPGFYSNGVDIKMKVKPYNSPANISFSWYTSNCEKSKPEPSNNTCSWVEEGGIFGVPGTGSWICRCAGVASNASRCGARPKNFTSLNYINFESLENGYSDWGNNKYNFLSQKKNLVFN